MQAIVHCLGKVHSVNELKYSDNGNAYLGFSFVQTSGFGENVHFDWFRATVFGKQAEGLAGKLIAGETYFSLVGRMKVKLYDKEDGTTGYNVEVTVMDFQFAGPKPQEDGERPQRSTGKPQKKASQKPVPEVDDDDVGF
jgi:single-stranded DNA-binding protein